MLGLGLSLVVEPRRAAAQPAAPTGPAPAVQATPAPAPAVEPGDAQAAAASLEAPPPPALPITRVQLTGALVRGDTERRVLDFLAIEAGSGATTAATPAAASAPPAKGVLWDEQLQSRVRRDLEVLGYAAELKLDTDGVLTIALHPLRIVRRIVVSGNWPIFEWEILSYLTWRTGYRLPEGDELLLEIRKQERELINFLQRKGYYDASAQIELDWAAGSAEQVTMRIQIHLGTGFWRLRYKLGTVTANKLTLLSQRELYDFFDHCCLWFGRTSTERITDDFKRLTDHYQSHNYAGVRLTKREIKPDRARRVVDIDLAVEERKRILLKFAGRHAVAEGDLRKVVTIFRDNYYSANELDESARNIYRYYQQQGYFEARVSWQWKNRTGDPLEVQFNIHEGPQLKVRDIVFRAAVPEDPLHYSVGKLSEQISTRRYPRLGFIGLGEGGFATAVTLEQDVKKLEDFYHREGYPHAQVGVAVARSQEALRSAPLLGLQTALDEGGDSGDLFLSFEISEGEREFVGGLEIQLTGKHTLTEAQVLKVLQLKPGKPYTPEALIADKLHLSALCKSTGHPYADIDPTRSSWNAEHTRVTLRWILDEHETVRFGPIIIRGNFTTRERLIRKDLPFKTGDPYDANKLLEAQQNLEGRQIFSAVHVIEDPGRSREYLLEAQHKGWQVARNPVPVLVEVVERYDYSGDITGYIGVSTYDSLFSSVSYTWRNLLGTGSETYLSGELGVRVQSLLARFTNPRVFGSFLRFDLRGFWRSENTYSVGLVTSYGANAELTRYFASTDEQGRRLPPKLRVFTRLEFNISQILVPLYRTEGSTNVSLDGDRTQSLKWTVGVVVDRRVGFEAPSLRLRNQPVPPNPLRPAEGYLLSAQATGALCCGFQPFNADGSFIALAGQAVLLKPFGPELHPEDGWIYGMRRFRLNLNLRVNYGIPLYRTSLPVVERYFAGGDSSTRGYDNDALRAEEVRSPIGPLGGEPAYRIVPQGGSARILSQIEWEFAITPKLLNWPWVGALFVDTGAVFDGWDKLRWNDVRFSVGVSILRLHTQFGALSLDYAYPLTLPGQDPLLQSDRWKREDWYQHFPGRIHFNWGMNISL